LIVSNNVQIVVGYLLMKVKIKAADGAAWKLAETE
jgi:hypothetical protein